MWFASFFVAASATMILPFLSLYIETLGDFSPAYIQRWAGYVFAITFLVAFFFSPIWGRIGDKYGRKLILVVTATGIGICVFLMGYVNTVTDLFILRALMGIVTGFIPTSVALISAQTKKEEVGKTLGTLQTGTVGGGLCGPLLGGILADSVGFQYTFVITGCIICLSALLVALGIKEVKQTTEKKADKRYSKKEVFVFILRSPALLSLMFVSLIIQATNFSIQPLLALYVTSMSTTENLAFLAGLAFSVTGLGNLLSTRKWGDLGDRFSHQKILLLLLILAPIFFIPQAFVTELWQLIILRFLYGLQIGGLLPCITAYIRQLAPLSIQGEVLGYNVSFRFLGNVIGPIMGGMIAGFYHISAVFIISGILMGCSAILLWLVYRKEQLSKKETEHLSA